MRAGFAANAIMPLIDGSAPGSASITKAAFRSMQSDICIIGNGAIGKTAALGLAQAGLSVTLLAPDSAPPSPLSANWDVRVYALNQVARSLLSKVKVWDALDAARIAPV